MRFSSRDIAPGSFMQRLKLGVVAVKFALYFLHNFDDIILMTESATYR